MKIILSLLLVTLLSGCFGSAPVHNPFPTPPSILMSAPKPLVKVDSTSEVKIQLNDSNSSSLTLSQLGAIISKNYTTCNSNAAQLSALQEWVNAQKALNPK